MDRCVDYEYMNSCRVLSGLTNKAIAEACHSSEPTISRFFRGELKAPEAGLFGAICDTIGASSDRALGIAKTIDNSLAEPQPSIPAVVTDVVQTISDIVDEKKVAEHVAEVIKETPTVDPKEIARMVIEGMPKPQPMECESCRTAKAYDATISIQQKMILALSGSLGLMVIFLMILLLKK